MASTTKSGTDQFHGLVSNYYNNESMFAKTVFMGPDDEYNPFHSNNFSFTVGGPIIPRKQFFFFFAAAAAAFVGLHGQPDAPLPGSAVRRRGRRQNYPNTFGTHILNTYKPSRATVSGVSQTASGIFPTTCGTPATNNLPCDLPMIDSGIFNSSNFRDGDQYFVRIDKHFKARPDLRQLVPHDPRLWGPCGHSRVLVHEPQHAAGLSGQLHARLRPSTLNEAIFAQNRIEGFIGETGDFTIPRSA